MVDVIMCDEIIYCFVFDDVCVFVLSFDCLNICYWIVEKDNVCVQLFDFICVEYMNVDGMIDVGVVYCLLCCKVEEMVEWLKVQGVCVLLYYVGMEFEVWQKYQEMFQCEEGIVMCVMIVFGMGIDKFDVCFVVYFDLLKSVEGYYQEIGCVGCDGMFVNVWMVYGLGDVVQ